MINPEEFVENKLYVPARTLTLIQGNETAERFDNMLRQLDKNRAANFWGVEEQWAKLHGTFFNTFIPRPRTVESRLLEIKMALRTVPDLDPFTREIVHVLPSQAIQAGYKKTFTKRIPNHSPKHKKAKLSMTFAEAHNTPDIRNLAVRALDEIGDPTIEVIRGLDAWRNRNLGTIAVSDSQISDGHETFEILLLTSDVSPYALALGHAAVEHASMTT